MNAAQVIQESKEQMSEWLEMSPNPSETLVGLLAQKIVNLNFTIECLQKRIKYMEQREKHVDALSNY